jgi:molybdate transport system substrate-binding protein
VAAVLAATIAAGALTLGGCRGLADRPTARHHVSVAAAADLRFVLEDLTAAFRAAHAGVDVAVTYGSSGTFYAQLLNRAPFDLFLSADVDYPRQLAAQGLAHGVFTYADGRLVVWVPASSPIDVTALGMSALAAPHVAHVAIANPAHAPYGRAAEAAMRRSGVYDRVKPKLVLGENVGQALQFVQSGAADVGLVALSLAVSPAVGSAGRYWDVPLDMYPRIEQGGAILQWAADAEAARLFCEFMTSARGRATLKRYGFAVPGE